MSLNIFSALLTDPCWVSAPRGWGAFYISKQPWPPGSHQHHWVPTWHPPPLILNFPAQGPGCPSPRSSSIYNPDNLPSPTSPPHSPFSFSLSMHFLSPPLLCLPPHGGFPGLFPWGQGACLPESSCLIRLHLYIF